MLTLWTGYSPEGTQLKLIAENRFVPKNMTLRNMYTHYTIISDCDSYESSDLGWIKTVFLLQLLVNPSHWKTIRCIAERRLILLNQLETSFEIIDLVHWTLQQKSTESNE